MYSSQQFIYRASTSLLPMSSCESKLYIHHQILQCKHASMQTRFKATNAQNLDAVLELVCSIVIKEPFYLNKNVFVKKKKRPKLQERL